ncbi:MAG: DUF4339 domain-containing protein [Bacteroidales bacterium]|nr:DUF4339 domain-containing protein [Bacteroidales bacterium]
MDYSYFYYEGSQTFGPVNLEELIKHITPDTQIWRNELEDWRSAKSVPEVNIALQEQISRMQQVTPPPHASYNNNSATSKTDSRGYVIGNDGKRYSLRLKPNYIFWYIISVIFLIFFLPGGLLNIVTLIFLQKSQHNFEHNNIKKSLEQMDNAKLFFFIALILGVVSRFMFISML